MKFFTLSFLVTACFASDNSSKSAPNAYLLPPLGIREYAISIGFFLGTSTEILIKDTSDGERISLFVPAKYLERVVVLNGRLEKEFRVFNRFAELFNCECLLEKLVSKTFLTFKQMQSLFLECSRIPEAKIAIDVAILKWLSIEIQEAKSDAGNGRVNVDPSILGSLCALSLDADDKTYKFTKDILLVLTQVQELIVRELLPLKNILPTLLTVMKLFDDGPIHTKAKEIITTFFNEDYQKVCPILVLTLGKDHALVKSIEATMEDEKKRARCDAELDGQLALKRKVHSLAIMPFLDPNGFSILAVDALYLKADIGTEGTLEWERTQASSKEIIGLSIRPDVINQTCLFIIFMIEPPADVCMEITSCASLEKFYELLEKPKMKQMILSYGVTILESDN